MLEQKEKAQAEAHTINQNNIINNELVCQEGWEEINEMNETVFTMCDVCEEDIEVPNKQGEQECPKCHHITYVDLQYCEC